MVDKLEIKVCTESDIGLLRQIFEDSVRGTCTRDYTTEQIEIWVEKASF